MEPFLLNLYDVKREEGRWLIVPSEGFVRAMVGIWGFGAAFMLYIASIFFRHALGFSMNSSWPDVGFGTAFAIVAGMIARQALVAWQTRSTALIVEDCGRVLYGRRELCAAGSVRAVRIAESRGGEKGDCDVLLEVKSGELVELPPHFFPGAKARELARAVAAALAEMLGVGVVETV